MSINAIDTQIMVQRTTDTVKDASVLHKNPQINQEFAADRTNAQSVLNQSTVQEATESEMQNIRTDVDGENTGEGGSGSEKEEKDEEDDEVPPELMVAPAAIEQIIDIMV